MRICFLIHGIYSGGAERTVSYLCNNFVKRQHCVVDLVQNCNVEPFYEIDKKVNQFYLKENISKNNIIDRIITAFILRTHFRTYCKKYRPDVIVCILSSSKNIALFKPKKIPIIVSERNNPELEIKPNAMKKRSKNFNSANGIIFQTERVRRYYVKYILKDKKKGVVIQNAIGNPIAYEINALDYPKKNKISAVGRIDAQKNYELLIEAFQKVHKVHPKYILEIYGKEGNATKRVKQLVIDYNLQNSIMFRGIDKEALRKIADSKCFVMSSSYEGMPNALMEAMAIGLPCVSTDCPNGPAELINNGENGLLVPVNDADALSTAINKIIEDENFATQCAKKARQILQTNNIDIISEKFYNYISEIGNKN